MRGRGFSMSHQLVIISNVVLLLLALYAFVRLIKRRMRNRPRRKNEMELMNERLTSMEQELKELDKRLKAERNWGQTNVDEN